MNPYIITTTPGYCSNCDNTEPLDEGRCARCAEPQLTRRAVATLDEAQTYWTRRCLDGAAACDTNDDTALTWIEWSRRKVPESGGAQGPLPDGTVIEVERTVSWGGAPIGMVRWLREEEGWSVPSDMDEADAVAAYNEAQAEET